MTKRHEEVEVDISELNSCAHHCLSLMEKKHIRSYKILVRNELSHKKTQSLISCLISYKILIRKYKIL